MNNYSICVKTVGEEHYTVTANSEEEAIELIRQGEGYLQSSEDVWDGDFFVEDVEYDVGDE